jgi:hypothetical protein
MEQSEDSMHGDFKSVRFEGCVQRIRTPDAARAAVMMS